MKRTINDLIKYAHLAQHLVILGDNIEGIYEELNRLQYSLAFIRSSSTPHSILSLDELKNSVIKMRSLCLNDEVLNIDFSYFNDLVKLGYFYLNMQIVIVVKVPIVYPLTYDLYKLTVVPNKYRKVLVPTLLYIAFSRQDSMYTKTEYPKVNSWFLCNSNANYRTRNESDCIQHLIATQELQETCKMTSVILTRAAAEQLNDEHYTLSFSTPTKVQLSCGQVQYRTLSGSFLAVIMINCYMKTPYFTLSNTKDPIKGRVLKIMEMPQFNDSISKKHVKVILNTTGLSNLHSIITKISLKHPVQIENVDDSSIYHTTIPLYVILLFCMITLTIVLTFQRLRS
ncbi:unnamed protein product [Danaus chrysippus]|uniref:(African queen) hypothetical protein n=1 Tax=Danaus chrysippus TaxID=151541 RepID=A0A8J2QUM1_9NEOP|nr:unnamed protein product [Danaus chrysippus]